MKQKANDDKYYKTSEIARITNVHPNTVRLYEQWGFIQPVPRNEKGYRLYRVNHLEQMRLARIAFRCEFVEGNIRTHASEIVTTAAKGDLKQALVLADQYISYIQSEINIAEEALLTLQNWLKGKLTSDTGIYYRRADVANLLGVSIDVLRNWERNGLIEIPRNHKNYRVYGSKEISRLKIIRTLRSANYSMEAVLRMMNYIDLGKKGNLREVINTPHPGEDIISATDQWITSLNKTLVDACDIITQLQIMIEMNL